MNGASTLRQAQSLPCPNLNNNADTGSERDAHRVS